jgi:hypothetical protein
MQWLMARTWTAVLLAASFLLSIAYAQNSELRVNVPFAFVAAGKSFPSGKYKFTKGMGTLVMTNADGKQSTNLPVITNLARSGPSDDHLLAFDKIGEERILSEIWLPKQEGALVYATKSEHKHEVIKLVQPGSR